MKNEKINNGIKILNEINDRATIEYLRACRWNTIEGMIAALKDFMEVNEKEAKEIIKEWLLTRGLKSEAKKI